MLPISRQSYRNGGHPLLGLQNIRRAPRKIVPGHTFHGRLQGGIMETIDRIWTAAAALVVALWIALAALVASLIAIGSWTHFFDMAPPKITLATGPRDLAYWSFGHRYQTALKGRVDIEVAESRGSPQNLKMLRAHAPDQEKPALAALIGGAGLIQGDTAAIASATQGLESLGAVFDDGLWLFRRREPGKEQPASTPPQKEFVEGLRGKRIAIGADESGTQTLALTLLMFYGLSEDDTTFFLRLKPSDAVRQLQAGTIDAAFFLAWWNAEAVQKLIDDPNVELSGYPNAGTLTKFRKLYVRTMVVPTGVFGKNIPPYEMTVAATRASLIVRKDLPLAVQYRLLKAIGPIHENPEIHLASDKFPSPDTPVIPLSAVAKEYYYNPDIFQRMSFVADLRLPLWITELFIQTLHSVAAITGIVSISLVVGMGASLIRWRRRLRVSKVFRELERLGEEMVELEHGKVPVDQERKEKFDRRLRIAAQNARKLPRGTPEAAVALLIVQELRRRQRRLGEPEGPPGAGG
jgi:TRAP-type uncharacterized transport system substrate-binding protein